MHYCNIQQIARVVEDITEIGTQPRTLRWPLLHVTLGSGDLKIRVKTLHDGVMPFGHWEPLELRAHRQRREGVGWGMRWRRSRMARMKSSLERKYSGREGVVFNHVAAPGWARLSRWA